jgi:hypothetical protein
VSPHVVCSPASPSTGLKRFRSRTVDRQAGRGRTGVLHGWCAAIRTVYDYQRFSFVGPYGDNGWLQDHTAGVHGEPTSNVTLVTRDAAGQAQHVVGNYRPRSTLLLVSRLIGDKLAETPYAGHFLASEP